MTNVMCARKELNISHLLPMLKQIKEIFLKRELNDSIYTKVLKKSLLDDWNYREKAYDIIKHHLKAATYLDLRHVKFYFDKRPDEK